jgi:hypothetical protein
MARKNKANYNSNPNYLDYLTALRKFFTNDTDIIPIIQAFNFYINGVYGIPYVDLFRNYDENFADIHGEVKTKQLIDDGTVGIINEQIYSQGRGSLITSLESMRIYLEDRSRLYTIAYNPFINAYAEYLIPKVNDLGTSNPVITTNGIDPNAAPIVVDEREAALEEAKQNSAPTVTPTKEKPKKSFWKKFGFLVYENSNHYKKSQSKKYVNRTQIK